MHVFWIVIRLPVLFVSYLSMHDMTRFIFLTIFDISALFCILGTLYNFENIKIGFVRPDGDVAFYKASHRRLATMSFHITHFSQHLNFKQYTTDNVEKPPLETWQPILPYSMWWASYERQVRQWQRLQKLIVRPQSAKPKCTKTKGRGRSFDW